VRPAPRPVTLPGTDPRSSWWGVPTDRLAVIVRDALARGDRRLAEHAQRELGRREAGSSVAGVEADVGAGR